MTILALDQSSRTSGYSVFQDDSLIDYGHWTFSDNDIAVRIHSLCQQIQKKIDQYKPDIIVFENIALERGDVLTFQKLAQVQGAIMLQCKLNKLGYKCIPVATWRAKCHHLKGNGKNRDTQKKIAQEWVKQKFNKICTEDEADAICIGYSETISQESQYISFT